MQVDCVWDKKSKFTATAGEFSFAMDASKPFGDESAHTPKQLVVAALCGCTGMDVVGLLKKNKQVFESFRMSAEAESVTVHPHELKEVRLKYYIAGTCDPDKVIQAVNLSQTQYCSVSAMISRGTKIYFEIYLNDKILATGQSSFNRDVLSLR